MKPNSNSLTPSTAFGIISEEEEDRCNIRSRLSSMKTCFDFYCATNSGSSLNAHPFRRRSPLLSTSFNFSIYFLQSHEFSKEPSIQLIMNSIDSNLSAVAGEQCKDETWKASIQILFISPSFRHQAPERPVDDDWRGNSAEWLRHLQLQPRLELGSVRRAWLVVELQLLLLQQEAQADRFLHLSRNQVSQTHLKLALWRRTNKPCPKSFFSRWCFESGLRISSSLFAIKFCVCLCSLPFVDGRQLTHRSNFVLRTLFNNKTITSGSAKPCRRFRVSFLEHREMKKPSSSVSWATAIEKEIFMTMRWLGWQQFVCSFCLAGLFSCFVLVVEWHTKTGIDNDRWKFTVSLRFRF